jgi:hypothetical protein
MPTLLDDDDDALDFIFSLDGNRNPPTQKGRRNLCGVVPIFSLLLSSPFR